MTVAVRAEGPRVKAKVSAANDGGAFGRFAITAVGLTLMVIAIGSIVSGSRREIVAGAVIALIASFAGTAPLRMVTQPGGASWVVSSVLAAMGVRMAVAIGLGIVAVLTGLFDATSLLLTLVAAHLVLLFADSGYARTLATRATQASVTAATGDMLPSADSTDSKMEDR